MAAEQTTTPLRIQRRRVKGWKMPEGAVYVGRGSRWGNPFRAGFGICETTQEAVTAFTAWWPTNADVAETRALRGKSLACWCRLDQPCHADVLLEIANASE